MTYGLNSRLFIENGPAIRAAQSHASSSSNAFRVWGGLDADRRLALIEKALRKPANDDAGDDFPIAL